MLQRLKEKNIEEEAIKKQARQEYLEQEASKIREIEAKRIQIEEETLRLEETYLQIFKKVQERTSSSTCAICLDALSNAVITPCGHACFCYECLLKYKFGTDQTKCPACRQLIDSITKLYM